jgi:hypothetical protein
LLLVAGEGAVKPISSARYQPVVPVMFASAGIRKSVRGVRHKSTNEGRKIDAGLMVRPISA